MDIISDGLNAKHKGFYTTFETIQTGTSDGKLNF